MLGLDALAVFEKQYKAVLEKTEFLAEGLELAISAEAAGRKAYLDLAASASFTDVASFFNFLAGEELLHLKMLEGVKESLESQGKWKPPTAGEEKQIKDQPPQFAKLLAETDGLKKNEIQSILKAIRIEREFRDFYAGMAKKTSDVNGKRMFSALADFEQKHYDLLSGLYDSTTGTSEYTMG